MEPWQIILIVIAVLVVIVIGWWISTSNKLKVMGVKIDEALSGIDVALTKRYDLLTKVVATVKPSVSITHRSTFVMAFNSSILV